MQKSHLRKAPTENFLKHESPRYTPFSLHRLPTETQSVRKPVKRNNYGLTVNSIFLVFQFVTACRDRLRKYKTTNFGNLKDVHETQPLILLQIRYSKLPKGSLGEAK